VSEDYNDHYTTQKLKSDYWTTRQMTEENDTWNDIAISQSNNRLCIANTNQSNETKLSLFQLHDNNNSSSKISLNKLHNVTLPKNNPVTTLSFVEFHSRRHHDNDLLLTAHQNGYVHLITTSATDGSQIVSRFNHSKFMTFDNDLTVINGAMPIRQLESDLNSNNGFVSLINESLFIYDISMNKSPTYLNHFPSINKFALHKDTPLVALGQVNGISFLDVRDANKPAIYSVGNNNNNITAIEWIDDHTISLGKANAGTVQLFDIRMLQQPSTTSIPLWECHLDSNSSVRSLKYNSNNKTLSVLDDMGALTRWDLATRPGFNFNFNSTTQHCYLKNGLHSVTRNHNASNVLQCGDTLVKNGNLSGMTLWKDAVIAHGLNELSMHRIVDIEMSTSPTSSKTPVSPTYSTGTSMDSITIMDSPITFNENVTGVDSDATSLFDSYSEDDHADIATLRPEPLSPIKNGNDSSMNKLALKNLSCQTMVETTTIF